MQLNNLNPKTIYLIAASLTLILIVAILVVISLVSQPQEQEELTEEEIYARDKTFELEVDEESIEKIISKGALSAQGEQTKAQVVARVGGQAGTLIENEKVRIYYLPPVGDIPDQFSVEIKITNIAEAKNTTWEWFKSLGFLDEDLCTLKVVFGMTVEVRQHLGATGEKFTPVFDRCEF